VSPDCGAECGGLVALVTEQNEERLGYLADRVLWQVLDHIKKKRACIAIALGIDRPWQLGSKPVGLARSVETGKSRPVCGQIGHEEGKGDDE